MKKRNPTARDVAAELGVSVKTVSNAYRRPDQLSADLRERILAAATRLGYPGPDPVASGLRRRRVGAIGVAYANRLSYAFDDPAARELLAGITGAAESAGAGLLLLPGSSDPEKRRLAINDAIIDGLIVASLADDDPILRTALDRHLPVVVVDQPRPELLGPGIPWVGVEDRPAAAQAADHLLRLGHRRIGVVCFGLRRHSPRGLADLAEQARSSLAVSRDRLAGYRQAAESFGLAWADVPVHQGTDSTPAEGETGALAVLAREPRPTALLCMSDRLAEGALRAAAALGLRVPRDLSIVGFDDAVPTAADLGLTTVRQPQREKGRLAAQALLGAPRNTTLLTELIVRRSTGPVPA